MTADAVAAGVRDIIHRLVGPARVPAHAGLDTRLANGYWLDSVEMLEVVLECERQFGITFEASRDLTPEALATVDSLAAVVCRRLGELGVHVPDTP